MSEGFDFGPLMDAAIKHSTVGFVKMASDDAISAGSGTLVRYGHVFGIITAAHVLDNIVNLKEIGLVFFPTTSKKIQKFTISIIAGNIIRINPGNINIDGPDYGIMIIESNDATNIKAFATFLNLERNFHVGNQATPAGCEIFWVVAGVVSEQTKVISSSESHIVKEFNGLMNVGRIIEEEGSGSSGYLRFRPTPDPSFTLPTSYQGTSGGGLWLMVVRKIEGNQYLLVNRVLLGVAYFEDPSLDGMDIICHGPNCLLSIVSHIGAKY